MSTIQASIQLKDGMSPALRAIEKTLTNVVATFDRLETALNRSLGTGKIDAANRQLGTTQQKVNRIEQNVNQAAAAERRFQQAVVSSLGAIYKQTTNQVRLTAAIRKTPPVIQQATAAQANFNNQLSKGANHANGLWTKIKSLAGAYMGLQAAKVIINTADQLTMTKARLDMINDGMQTTAELEDKIYQMAQRSRGGFMEAADAVAKFGQRTGNLFKSNDETIAFTETLNKMFVIAGASSGEMASATLQLTQALGSGVLRGEEFNAVFEAAPNVMQAVADYIGKPIGSLKELASEGKISAETVKNALFAASKDVEEKFAKMPYTWAQVWETIKNYTIKATRPILQAISDITRNKRFIAFANEVGNIISRIAGFIQNLMTLLKPALNWILDTIANIYNYIKDNWSMIAPILAGVGGAFLALKAKIMAVAIWSGICAVATGVMTAAKIVATFFTWAFTSATLAQAGAQWGLNAAMYACPLTWIVIAIIAVIVVIYLAVAAINHFAGTSYSATGFIAGLFMALYASIYNNVALLWNTFASFAEFLVNVFKHPAYATKKLFVNLAVNIIDCLIAMTKSCDEFATSFVNAMYEAINWVLDGWNWMVDKLGIVGEKMGLGKAEKLTKSVSITSDLANAKADLEASVAEMPEDYWTAPRMDYKDIGESYMTGYNWGSDLATQTENFFAGKKFQELFGDDLRAALENGKDKYGNPIGTDPLNDIGKALSGGGAGRNPALDDIAKGVDGIGKDASAINDKLDTSTEDLSFMRDLAEQRVISRHYYTDLTVTQNNTNNIRNGADADGIIEKLRRGIYETMNAGAEGVHY